MHIVLLKKGSGNTMPYWSHFTEDTLEISVYLSWDKDLIALAKKGIKIISYIFFLFLEEYVVGMVYIRSASVKPF